MRPLLIVILALVLLRCGSNVTRDGGIVIDSGSTLDAGTRDAGEAIDAGQVFDAGVGDAGSVDASSFIDAGSADSGAFDAGIADAGTPIDAGVPDAGLIRTGALVGGTGSWPGFISGVAYRSGTLSGFTDDAGRFSWREGTPVTFSVGDVDLGSTSGQPMLSAWQLVGTGACVHSAALERLLVLLASLDVDADPATGTTVTPLPPQTTQRQLAALSDAGLEAVITSQFPTRVPVTTLDAVDRFINQVDDEVWAQRSLDTFNGTSGASRSQGVATDGTNWYFSWRLGLERSDAQFNAQRSNNLAIPLALALGGSNHIGDIDVDGTTLWAPIEDGTAYQHPYLVEFDTMSLNAGTAHPLSTMQLTQGVPWVAVDRPNNALYVAEWSPTLAIVVYSLSTVTYQRSIPIRPALTRIQGAKMFEGHLYASTDDAMKTVYKLNLETGTVLRLFSVTGAGEMEGFAFLPRADGTTMHTLNATPSATAMEFRHHQRTRLPLRRTLCP